MTKRSKFAKGSKNKFTFCLRVGSTPGSCAPP